MKKILFITSAVAISLSANVFAHQLKNDTDHNTSWNWNASSHTHETSPKASTNVVKGLRGLDSTAKIGECYATAYVEAVCQNENKKVLIKEAYNETEIVPAVTKEVEKTILVSDATTIEEYIPALYENVNNKVLIEAAHSEWKKGNSTSIQKVIDGDTYCLVQVPARYKNKVERVLKIPASTKIREVAAVYKTYKETIIIKPATTRVTKSHPAVYNTVEECVEKAAGRYEWRSILCEQNATTSVLRSFEKALSDEGHLLIGNVDGVINDKTSSAVKAYQRAKGLSVDGLVNIETVKSLGVKY